MKFLRAKKRYFIRAFGEVSRVVVVRGRNLTNYWLNGQVNPSSYSLEFFETALTWKEIDKQTAKLYHFNIP